MNDAVYTNSIITYAFTNDGKMIVRKDTEEKIDTLPWIFLGCRDENDAMDYENSIWVMNHMDEYKEKISSFFAYHSKDGNAIIDGFCTGSDILLDVGELHEKIAANQIEEMRTLNVPSYIRVNRGLYDGGEQNGQSVINRIETRYVVLPSTERIENYPNLEAKYLDELREDFSLLSDKIILGITGEEGKIMESFLGQLTSFHKESSSKK